MKMNRNRITILTVILTVTVVSLRSVPAAEKPSADAPPDDRATIQKSVESYVAAFNAKDARALAAHWSPEGVYIDRTSGQRTTGRDALEKEFQATLQTQKDARLNVKVESLEFVSPSVAIEQGAATIITPDSDPIVSSYSAVHVKRDGKWLIDRVSEQEIVSPPSHYEQLKDLEWMIGDWVDQAGKGVVASECHWARNNNFIIRSFTVSVGMSIDMAGMQIIGWDPARKQIRSWVFDSDGGFNEGTWQKVDGQWTVQTTATLPDGRRASSTSVMKPVDDNSFAGHQVNRVVDGELLPNIDEIVIVRSSAE
jgi:uncharacterized protein (TIGR02246 family)